LNRREESEQRFRDRYSIAASKAAREVEREVIGANVGANGYTTLRQADLLAERLGLGPDTLLLDVGCGRGWPGLYLAKTTGCRAVLADVPEPALRTAVGRADRDRLGGRASVVRASGMELPFRPRSFDAVTHTDTL
jgi:ubiquinone/menaquinone biosynthesis C-methylase UbiE